MNRRNSLLICLAFLAFTAIAFITPFVHNTSFWIAYGFLAIAFLLEFLIWGKTPKSNDTFLNIPNKYIGVIYIIIQLIVSFSTMILNTVPPWIPLLFSALLLCFACFSLVVCSISKKRIERIETHINVKTSYIQQLQNKIDLLITCEKDDSIKKELKSLSDLIRYSDPISNSSLSMIEDKISEKVSLLMNNCITKKELIEDVKALLMERNLKCKALK